MLREIVKNVTCDMSEWPDLIDDLVRYKRWLVRAMERSGNLELAEEIQQEVLDTGAAANVSSEDVCSDHLCMARLKIKRGDLKASALITTELLKGKPDFMGVKRQLSSTLQALATQREVWEARVVKYDAADSTTPRLIDKLIRTLRLRGDQRVADRLEQELNETNIDDPAALAVLSGTARKAHLGLAVEALGSLNLAEKLALEGQEESHKSLGPLAEEHLYDVQRVEQVQEIRNHLRDLENRLWTFGQLDESVLTAKSEMGRSLAQCGDYQGAKELLRESYQLRRALYGEATHLELKSKMEYADLVAKSDEMQRGEQLLQEVVEEACMAIGVEAHTNLFAMSQLAMCLKRRGHLKGAEELLRELIRLSPNGPIHHYTVQWKHELSLILQAQGRLKEAEDLQRRVLDDFVRIEGPEHRRTITQWARLVKVLRARGHLEEAEKMQEGGPKMGFIPYDPEEVRDYDQAVAAMASAENA